MSNVSNALAYYINHENDESQLVPGSICYGVYVAIKMRTLKFDFKIPLLK